MATDIVQFLLYTAILLALAWPLGGYMARVFQGERTLLSPALVPVERGIYALAGKSATQDQHWTRYAFSVLAFSLAGWLFPRRTSPSTRQ